MLIGYWWESQEERDHWEDQDVSGWTISKWILERWVRVNRMDMAQDKDQCRALVNTVLNLREMLGSSCVVVQLMAPQEGLSSVSKY
jgi:hypothetical protein